MDDFFAELEAEIATHTAKAKLKSDAEAARKKAHNTRLSPAARAEAASTYKELSAIVEAEQWGAVSTVALFTEQTCDGCGSVHRVFLQYMEVQAMIRKPSTQRWVRISKPVPEEVLPRETLIQPHRTHICSHCCEDHGFALEAASHLPVSQSALSVSQTYLQEDINAAA